MAFSKYKKINKKSGKFVLSAGIDMSIYATQQNHDEVMKYYSDFDSIEIDLSTVGAIDCSRLQLLLALKHSSEKDGKNLILKQPSIPVVEAMDGINLKDQFNWSDRN
jgi:anti-anti-sigma regulatory factor